MENQANLKFVQYAFLDVVKFTVDRTVEAQVHILENLNRLVREALAGMDVKDSERILLPTGDGLCVAFLRPEPFDQAVRFSVDLLRLVHGYNVETEDNKRRFEIRLGVNQNADNLFTDINGRPNVAGRGINLAQRIMSLADGGHLLVGGQVHELLCERDTYVDQFVALDGHDKHGYPLTVHQLRNEQYVGLNVTTPIAFATKVESRKRLSQIAAHFIANAYKYREFLVARMHDSHFGDVSLILLHLLSHDSAARMEAGPYDRVTTFVEFDGQGTPMPTYRGIEGSYLWLRHEFAHVIPSLLGETTDCFEGPYYAPLRQFPSRKGIDRVRDEQHAIWSFVVGQGDGENSGE